MSTEVVQTEKLDFDKVWLMFQETSKQLNETKLMIQDTSLQMKETDKKIQETDQQMKETDKKLRKLEYLFTSQWGKLMESLVEGDIIKLLNEREIAINVTSTRVNAKYNGRQYEFDIIAENGKDIVVVEVKTTLRPDDVKEFIEELKEIKSVLPKYKENNVYGAVAYLKEDSGAVKMAMKNKLFVIRATGSSASIENSQDFVPKAW